MLFIFILFCVQFADGTTDIVFVLDASGSVSSSGFQQALDFVGDFVKQLDGSIDSDDIQVSVVLFTSSVDEQFQLNQYQDQTSLLTAIATIAFTSGGSNAADAIQFVYEESFSASKGARANSNKLVMIITDGGFSSSTGLQAELLQTISTVIAIGIGRSVDFSNLQAIASTDSLALPMANSDALDSIKGDINFLQWKRTISATDIVFALDFSGSVGSSYVQQELDFVRDFVSLLIIGPEDVQVSVIVFDDNEQFPLNQYQDLTSLQSAISAISSNAGGGSSADIAIRYIYDVSFSSSKGARTNANKLVVLITDGGYSYSSAEYEASVLKKIAAVIAIGINVKVIATDGSLAWSMANTADLNSIIEAIDNIDWTVDDTDIISEDEEDERLTAVQLFGIITGCLILLILVGISIPIEMKRRTELHKRQDFLRHCDVAPLNATTWNLLVVVDARDAIMMYTEKLINALRCLKPTPTIKRTNIHRLHIETETVSASKTVFFISEGYTRPSDCVRLCAKIKLAQDISGSALLVSLDSSCSNGKIYPLIKNKADICVSPSTDTVANVNMLFKAFADFYFQCKRNGHCFHVDQTINRNSKSGKLQDQITDHLQSFGFKQTETKTPGDIVIYVIDDVMDLNDVIGVTGTLKSYIFVNVIKAPTMHVLTSSTNIAIFSRDEVVKGVLKILTDSKIIRANMSSKGYTYMIQV